MKKLTISIADNKFKAFLEFIKTLDYVEIESGTEQQALEELQTSLQQVKQMQTGQLPKQTAKDFLDEL